MEIKIGNYIRTKDGYIGKIVRKSYSYVFRVSTDDKINEPEQVDCYIMDTNNCFKDEPDEVYEEDIIKSSPNIIDLIEEFDYIKMNDWGNIKFWRVVKAPYGKLMFEDDGWNELEDFEDEEIAEIITHEQMESIAYKVGE